MCFGKAVGPALRATFNLRSSHLDDLNCCDTVLAPFITYLGSDAATDEVNAGLPRTALPSVCHRRAPKDCMSGIRTVVGHGSLSP